jgi:hypothetical protein
MGIEVVVYCNESTVKAETRSYYPLAEWPLSRIDRHFHWCL